MRAAPGSPGRRCRMRPSPMRSPRRPFPAPPPWSSSTTWAPRAPTAVATTPPPAWSSPAIRTQLVQAVVDANPNTIVVAMTGAPVYMPWTIPHAGHNAVKSILQMWYPGQRGGIATANVVLGTVNPGGKLPETFPVDANHFAQNETGCDGSTNLGTSAAAHPGAPPRSAPARSTPACSCRASTPRTRPATSTTTATSTSATARSRTPTSAPTRR